jgi:hypothetical protein
MPSFRREVKPFAPCRRFAACKRSLNGVEKGVISAKLPDHSRPQFHLSLLGALAFLGTLRHLAAKVGTSKGRGKHWQTSPKNFPRMQRARAIPVVWLGFGSSQNRPKSWILNNQYCLHSCSLILIGLTELRMLKLLYVFVNLFNSVRVLTENWIARLQMFIFSAPCIVTHLRDKYQQYALFFLNLFQLSILYMFRTG